MRPGSGVVGVDLRGRFPYNSTATLRDRGRIRKERFGRRAFRFTVDGDGEVNLLRGHSFDSPLASRGAGTLELIDADDALEFRATFPPVAQQPTWMRDSVLAVEGGLLVGVSPWVHGPAGGRGAERRGADPRTGQPEDVDIMQINEARLYELSSGLPARRTEIPTLDLRSWDALIDSIPSGSRAGEERNEDDRLIEVARIWL